MASGRKEIGSKGSCKCWRGFVAGWLVLANFAVLSGVVMPIRANAYAGFTVSPPMRYGSFSLNATKGVRISVFVYAHQVTLEAEQARGSASVLYRVPGSFRKGKIAARFGRLGFIRMRWEPKTAIEISQEPLGDCHGRRALVQQGAFVGHFVFRGEGRFTESSAARVPGLKVRSFRTVCRGPDAGSEPAQQPEESLLASSRSGDRAVHFRASTRATRGGRIEEFEADAVERVGELSIDRSVLAGGAAIPGEFTFDPAAGTARVESPVPFKGTGALDQAAGEVWTGNLTVGLLGLGQTSLTGSAFKARLVSRDGGIQPFGSEAGTTQQLAFGLGTPNSLP